VLLKPDDMLTNKTCPHSSSPFSKQRTNVADQSPKSWAGYVTLAFSEQIGRTYFDTVQICIIIFKGDLQRQHLDGVSMQVFLRQITGCIRNNANSHGAAPPVMQ
jgi:hypothetical protein